MFTLLVQRECLDRPDARLVPEADLPVEEDILGGQEVGRREIEGVLGPLGE